MPSIKDMVDLQRAGYLSIGKEMLNPRGKKVIARSGLSFRYRVEVACVG